jgi:rhomboid protease GluP
LFRRNREALWAGEWWRMVTPLLVQANGWTQCLVNGVGALVFCPVAEKFYGKKLLALYFVSGVVGEVYGYAWNPNGAGSSVGIAGVIGGLFAYCLLNGRMISRVASVFAICGIWGAIALCFQQDIHGPPILVGALLGAWMTLLWPNNMLNPAGFRSQTSD